MPLIESLELNVDIQKARRGWHASYTEDLNEQDRLFLSTRASYDRLNTYLNVTSSKTYNLKDVICSPTHMPNMENQLGKPTVTITTQSMLAASRLQSYLGIDSLGPREVNVWVDSAGSFVNITSFEAGVERRFRFNLGKRGWATISSTETPVSTKILKGQRHSAERTLAQLEQTLRDLPRIRRDAEEKLELYRRVWPMSVSPN